MKATKIKTLLKNSEIKKSFVVQGLVKSFREKRFIALNDGSSLKTCNVLLTLKIWKSLYSKELLLELLFA